MLAQELGLAWTVGLLAMPADGARPAGIARVHGHDGNTRELGLVLHERSELEERPSRMSVALPLPNWCPVADALEVFKSDSPSGAFGVGDDGLADAMVLLFAEPGFLARQFLELFLGALGSFALASLAAGLVLASNLLDSLAGMHVAIGIDRDVHDTKIDTQEVRRLDLGSIGDVNRHQKEPLSVLAKYEVALALRPTEPLGLVVAHDERNEHPALQGRDTHAVRSLEPDVLTHRIRDRGVLAKLRTFVFVSLVRFANLGDATDRHVGGKSEPLAKLSVAKLLKLELVGQSPLERNSREPRRGFVESLDSGLEFRGVFEVRQELGLQRELHDFMVWAGSAKVQGRFRNSTALAAAPPHP